MTRYVLDANVLVSALLFNDSVPGRAFGLARRHGTILVSDASLSELRSVLGRAKFDRYLTRTDRDDFLLALTHECELVEIYELVRACRDPKDDHVLEVAVNGRATAIVTGDEDLLELNPFRGVEIVTPRQLVGA